MIPGFYVWTEKRFGNRGNLKSDCSCVINFTLGCSFLTGAGGFLQNVAFGYGGGPLLRAAVAYLLFLGIDVREDRLIVRPTLPPHGVRSLKLRGTPP